MNSTKSIQQTPEPTKGKIFRFEITEAKKVIDRFLSWDGGIVSIEQYELVSEEERKRGGAFGSYLVPAKYFCRYTVDFNQSQDRQACTKRFLGVCKGIKATITVLE